MTGATFTILLILGTATLVTLVEAGKMQLLSNSLVRHRRAACAVATSRNSLTAGQRDLFLTAHNVARKRAKPEPANMKDLEWDSEMANLAQYWANQCKFEHDHMKDCNNDDVGQNLFISSLGDYTMFDKAVEAWENEKQYYNIRKGTCKDKQMCGHYTQVVWAKTSKVGCAYKTCPKLKVSSTIVWDDATLIVCYYTSPGNYKGQKPYEIVKNGDGNGGSADAECEDIKSEKYCQGKKAKGFCKAPPKKVNFMQKKCKKTCSFC